VTGPMRINIVNPNTTRSMTVKIAAAARAAAAPGTEVAAVQPDEGPPSIEGYLDEALSVPGLLAEIVKGERAGVGGHVIACFDDTGLDAARVIARAPVVGIGEAACHLATLVAGRFAVVTTLSRSVPAIEHNLVRYGLAPRCARVRASEVPVLDLDEPGSPARRRIAAEIEAAIREDRAEAIVLGCAGMADLAADLSVEFGVPVVEGVSAAVKLIEALAALGIATSKIGGYAPPRAKAYSGPFQALLADA
jgi:allantoin racemase